MATPPKAAFSLGPTSSIKWQPYARPCPRPPPDWGLGGGHAWLPISLAALGMHARDTSFRVYVGGGPLAVGVHDYYAHAWDAAMPGMRNMLIGGMACMPGVCLINAASTPYPKRFTNAACTPYPKRLANTAHTPYLRDVHPGSVCMPMDYESVSPT